MASSSTTATADSDSYDHVVIASHSDQALAMLSDADARERAILGAIGYSPNTVYLHRDASADAEAPARLGVVEFPALAARGTPPTTTSP